MRNSLCKYQLITLLGLCAFGHDIPTGSISGTVNDPNGSVVAGVNVTMNNATTTDERTIKTNGKGTFSIPSLVPGVYTVKITASGFKKAIVTAVATYVGKPSTVNVTLEVGGVTETVTVTADSARQASVNGHRKGPPNITLDGIDVHDNLLKSIDSISEVSVTTTTPGAESVSGGGVQIKFATEGGTNDFHGGAFWLLSQPSPQCKQLVQQASHWFTSSGTDGESA